jgi:4-hydroxy-3-methylbut-2-enyl diphosphate reductase
VIVVGSRSSSNSNRLREVAELIGSRAYLVDEAEQIDPAWLAGASRVGVTAGASAPGSPGAERRRSPVGGDRSKVDQLDGAEENVTFALPRELQ